ncbi:MAG: thiamine phosphate synthase [Chloroflexi bacterium]|nr:thiamine phosphate synthase [Chloroflexota bacterium]
MTANRGDRIALPALVLVTDAAHLRGRDLAEVARQAVEGGVSIVQLREKGMPHDDLVALAERVHAAIAGRALLFINTDVIAAVRAGAEGVHLPESAPPTADIRASVGDHMLISRAVHGIDAALQAEREGADLLQLGTVFETASKPGAAVIGVDGVREICARVSIPVVAIGGITAANAAEVMRAGAAGVAVIGSVLDAADARAAAAALRAAISAPVRA